MNINLKEYNDKKKSYCFFKYYYLIIDNDLKTSTNHRKTNT